MTASFRTAPIRRQVLEVLTALIALGVTLPVSPPDGSGRQWDNAILAAVAAAAAWRASRLLPAIHPDARRPWQWLATGAALFAVASLVTATGLSPAFGGLGLGDALLVLAACVPPAVCAMLATKATGTRWTTLAIDGLTVTVALLVVADVCYLHPALSPGAVPPSVRTLVFAYGSYAAVAVGLAGALCTVSAVGLRRPASWMVAVTGLLALAAAMLAASLVTPAQGWQAVGDTACVLAMAAGVAATSTAAQRGDRQGARASSSPHVNPAGLAITIAGLAALPVALVLTVALSRPLPSSAILGSATVVALLLARMLLRIRDNGRMSEHLLRSEEDFRSLVEASSDGVAIVDDEFRLEFTSPAARTLLGLPPSTDPHLVLLDLLHEEDRARARAELSAVGAVTPAVLLRVRPAGGEFRDLEVTHHERPGSGRRVLHLRDVTTRRRRERELERMAFTDHLTRLPNRAMLFQEMAARTPSAGERSLLVLDLDGFKAVNDTAGHEAGDLLLVEVARRLQGLMRAEDLVARLGGDEFAVLLAGGQDAAVEAAQRIVDVLAQPYRAGDRISAIGASVGLARVRPGGGQLAFREADTALRSAKQAGKGCWRVHSGDRLALTATTSDVAVALADGDVGLRYDLIVDGDTGVHVAATATPVWVHPELGALPAAELWAAAERQGHTGLLQQWLLTRSCAEVAAISDRLLLCVDLPAGHVHAEDLPGEVAAALAGAGLAPARLTLSFTEEVLQTASAALIPALLAVHEAGVQLALSDYGMGSTLWAHLARLPLDVVMVDVRDLAPADDPGRALKLLTGIHQSTSAFGVRTVATAVATRELFAAIHTQGLVAIGGPVLPTALTSAALGDLLRHTPAAVVATR